MDERDQAALGFAELLLLQISPAEAALLEVFGPALVEQRGVTTRGDGSLGFGVTEIAWLSASVPVATAVVTFLGEVAKDALAEELKTRLQGWLAAMRARRGSTSSPPALPTELASRAGEVAYQHALAVGLDESKARLLGAAVHGTLSAPAR